ncbi:cytochrome b561 [Sideroxyarcus emersonii]|uniref:Cytochrome b561 n=1 Tax=Sideroxyarcus emersonii TaxID=2764705 RepID=A0AAN1X8S8_9PROT|nr:cytochrome b [Sideroxyarcus emersonii]BCK87027.1 cytochrome b561 [Sideroxyarcus emersonii]
MDILPANFTTGLSGVQPTRSATRQYATAAVAMHWLMAFAIVGLFAFGLYMHDLPLSPWKLRAYSWHKWAGVSIFGLAVVRLAWRIYNRPPELPPHMGRAERFIAHSGHSLLYLLMFTIPLSGWLMSSAKGFQTVLFGVLPLPDLLSKNKELGDMLQTVHWSLNLVLAILVAGHVAAALKHHFVDRDDVLARMLPRLGKSR